MTDLDDLLRSDRAGLAERLRSGHPVEPEQLAGASYHGLALCLPRWVEALTWRRFSKVFWSDDGDAVRGWNVRITRGETDDPWEPLRDRRGRPRTFGHFRVVPASDSRPLMGCGVGVVLDYGRVLDPLVAVNQDDPNLLLGCSVLDLGLARVSTPTFFCLSRAGAPEHVAPTPTNRLGQIWAMRT